MAQRKLSELTIEERYAYELVKELQAKCEAEHRAPVNVNLNDLLKRSRDGIKSALNRFVEDGTMVWYKNINQIPLFEIKNELK